MLQRQHNRVVRGIGAGSCGHFRQGMEVAKQSPEKVEEAAVTIS